MSLSGAVGDGRVSAALRAGEAHYPEPDLQWIEDRFWTWVHYAAGKIGRGELFEAVDFLAFLRARVLGPLALAATGAPAAGLRRLEAAAPRFAMAMEATIAGHTSDSCAAALRAAIELYREPPDHSSDRAARGPGVGARLPAVEGALHPRRAPGRRAAQPRRDRRQGVRAAGAVSPRLPVQSQGRTFPRLARGLRGVRRLERRPGLPRGVRRDQDGRRRAERA